jgi:hypothetical protein
MTAAPDTLLLVIATCVKLLMLVGPQLYGRPPLIPAEDIWAAYALRRDTNAARVPGG